MSAVDPSPSAQEQLDQLELSRVDLGKRQMMPPWWYVVWGFSFMSLWSGSLLPESLFTVWLCLLAAALLSFVLLGWVRIRRRGFRVPRLKDPAPLWRQFLLRFPVLCLMAVLLVLSIRDDRVWAAALLYAVAGTMIGAETWLADRRSARALQDLA